MKIESLSEFIVFSQYMNFTVAARKLYITQPALSYRIASMERELGFALVDRSEPMSITPAGKVFLSGAQQVVRNYESVVKEAEAVACQHPDTLVLEKPTGLTDVSSSFFALVNGFMTEHPRACVAFRLTQHRSLTGALRDRKVDAGIVFDPDCLSHMDDLLGDAVSDTDDLKVTPLSPSLAGSPDQRAMYVLVPRESPLADASRSLTLKDFDGCDFAFQGDERFAVGRAAIRSIFARGGVRIGFVLKPEQDDIDFIWDVAPSEMVVSDSSIVGLHNGNPPVLPHHVVRRIEDELACYTPCLLTRADDRSETLRLLIDYACDRDR